MGSKKRCCSISCQFARNEKSRGIYDASVINASVLSIPPASPAWSLQPHRAQTKLSDGNHLSISILLIIFIWLLARLIQGQTFLCLRLLQEVAAG